VNTLAIPSQVIALLTFPGVVLHEVVVQLLCRWLRIAMGDVCYIRFGSPAGYVIHEPPADVCQALVLGLGPFFVNSILGAFIAFPAIFPALEFRVSTTGGYVLAWLGVSIATHAFPSADETGELWRAVWSPRGSTLTRLFTTPLVAFMYGGALGHFICLDLLYGIGVVVLAPALLLYTLP
jgi:hypothetical protein